VSVIDKRYRVLVLDADMVPALTISRSLSRKRCEVSIGSHTASPLSKFSNAVNAWYRYPDPLADSEAFVSWLIGHTQENHYELIIPVTERTLVALSGRRERFAHVKIAMPDIQSLELVLDKSKTIALADRLGVPRPQGLMLTSIDHLSELKQTLKYPLVLKPVRSIGSTQGGASHLQVSYAFDANELEAGCVHALRFGPVLLQEFVSGVGVGIELIARNGEILYAFQHRRIHEVPLTGGGSSLRMSEPVMPQLLEASRRLVEALGWNGVAMVEFKLDPASREFYLMEINGRFWGSLPLAVAAGADFPSMLFDLEIEGVVIRSKPYINNVYCRLLSRDLHWYEAIIRGGVDTRIVRVPSNGSVIRELGLFFNPRHRFDVQSLLDPVPGMVDLIRILVSYSHRFHAFVKERRFYSQQRRAWKTGEVSSVLERACSMLFLCYGNINRSALADVMIRAYAEDSGISVASAGFHEVTDRPADPIMSEIAAQYGFNMAASRSACVTPQLLRDSDIIFVMEKVHYDRILAIDETIAGKVYLLGASHVTGSSPVEIADPYGRARDHYIAAYQQIAASIDRIKEVIAVRGSD
jgi:predicted ATP-grasp superfamily ATP-dependent carboligase/protein-tyrosine-phosphatase